MTRSTAIDVTFANPFTLQGVEGAVAAGTYRVDIEEELIDGLSFLAYRRLATFISIPMLGANSGCTQSFLIDPKDLAAAQARDGAGDGDAIRVRTPPPTAR